MAIRFPHNDRDTVPRYVPNALTTLRGRSPVVRVEAFTPQNHPADSAINRDLTLVRATCANGDRRDYGFNSARIGPSLRMEVSGFGARFEEVAAWAKVAN